MNSFDIWKVTLLPTPMILNYTDMDLLNNVQILFSGDNWVIQFCQKGVDLGRYNKPIVDEVPVGVILDNEATDTCIQG